ncbi:hypothetical protein HYC85_006598 [Camellia sinensis]|uniref:Thaumatin-like protein n=1 Tax=Camellia sinensis TaxID=4442 RepID=A0A7J7HLH7_CAMSI|nr:hypothetical protein HYC85_006598 [Camellia sinensis]
MATLPSISSSFLPSTALTIHPQYQQQFSLFFSPNQSIKTSPNRMAFKVQAAKLPAGVELPKVEPKFKAPFLGFTRTAETWKSRAYNKQGNTSSDWGGYWERVLLLLSLYANVYIPEHDGAQLIVVNNCNESIWPALLGGTGHPTPKDGGFHLSSGKEIVVDVPQKWSGRVWARQGCNFHDTGKGSCDTGDCSGRLQCQGLGGIPPATVVEMTLGTSTSPLHYYDVSLVDGFNLPVSMAPVGGGIGCGMSSCEVDLNIFCPSALEKRRGGKVVGCKSALLGYAIS